MKIRRHGYKNNWAAMEMDAFRWKNLKRRSKKYAGSRNFLIEGATDEKTVVEFVEIAKVVAWLKHFSSVEMREKT